MVYNVLITQEAEDSYTARAVGLPDLTVSGTSEAAVLEQLRETLEDIQARSRTVQLEVPELDDEVDDPWLRFAGMWADDPSWDEFQAEIEAFRRAVDEDVSN